MEQDLQISSGPTNTIPISTSTQTQEHSALYTIKNFTHDDYYLHFYTGLETYEKFCFVLHILGPNAYQLNYIYNTVNKISIPDQFFLTLIKLRRHRTNKELAYMFNISETTVRNIWTTWINFMYYQWKELDMWPSRDQVKFYAPSDFYAKYPSTRLIIDGTEVPIQTPSLPRGQQDTWSTYKHKNTMKVLIGCTPGGLITYVSPAYCGSTSDRQIVERSNLLEILEPGDSIMAD